MNELEELRARVDALEKQLAALSRLTATVTDAFAQLQEGNLRAGAIADGQLGVASVVTTALLAHASPEAKQATLAALQVALETIDERLPPEHGASFRQQAEPLFPGQFGGSPAAG
jgi:hypothetical protein